MKYLIISDIHGSYRYLSLAIKAYNDFSCDKIICLGDVLYHGPRNDLPVEYNPKECIKLLNDLASNIICVRGNCDAEVDQMVLSFLIEDPHYIDLNGRSVYLTHGHHLDLVPAEAKIIFHGHDHIHRAVMENNRIIFNPGSTSIPKGDKINSFGIADEKALTVYDFSYSKLMEIEY